MESKAKLLFLKMLIGKSYDIDIDEDFDIIEKDLDKLEKYDKALELVKTKRVDITNDIVTQRNYEWYMDYAICHDFISAHLLERDEWNLLKEVFG